MKRESDYKGYHLVCRHAGRWFAQIYAPGSRKPLSEIPHTNNDEGYETMISLAHAVIDRDLEKHLARA